MVQKLNQKSMRISIYIIKILRNVKMVKLCIYIIYVNLHNVSQTI
jgi:hypothetical protein